MTDRNEVQLAPWRVERGVAHLVLNRPDRANAIDLAFSRALAASIDAVAAADGVRAVLVSAAGPRFCVGGDIDAFVAHGERIDRLIDDILAPLNPALLRLANLTVPVISAVNGPVGGAGIGLALCADVVLASDTMKLRAGYSGIGLSPDAGASYFLAQRVGASKAKELFFFNATLSAQECLQLGIVNAVLPAAELAGAAAKLAEQAAAGSARSMRAIKTLCDGAARRPLAEHLALERHFLVGCAEGADAKEGVRAFTEKRAPRFGEA